MAIIPPTLGVDIRAALVDNTGQAFTSGSPLPVTVISGGGGSQTDASAWTTGVTQFAPGGGVFNDSATDLTSGQQGTLRLTAKRAQHVNIRSAAGVEITSFGLSAVDKAGFTEGTSLMTPAGGVFNDTISADPTEDQTAALRITAKRGLHTNLRTAAGVEIGIAAAPLIAAGAKTTNAAVPGATNIGTLPALANAVAPTLTEAFQAALSVDLGGSLRVVVPGAVDTELPAAAALGDNVANPTTPMIGAANMLWVSGASQWIRQGVASQVGDSATGGSSPSVMLYGFNGATFSRLRVDPTNFNLLAMAQGTIAHGTANSGNPLTTGRVAIAHGTNPTAVAAAARTDTYANRAGIPFMIGGHPNIVTIRANYTAAQTDTAIVTVAGGLKIVVTRITLSCDKANSVNVQARVGFGTTNTPTTTGVLATHPGIDPGGGMNVGNGAGIIGVGADGEDLRITCAVPTGGSIDSCVSYYTVES